MKVRAELHDSVRVIRVRGRIDGSNAAAFDSAVGAAIDDSDRAVLMDLEELSYISTMGLRTFPKVARAIRDRAATLALCSMPDQVRRVFGITGFDRVIPIYGSRSEALSRLAPLPPEGRAPVPASGACHAGIGR